MLLSTIMEIFNVSSSKILIKIKLNYNSIKSNKLYRMINGLSKNEKMLRIEKSNFKKIIIDIL